MSNMPSWEEWSNLSEDQRKYSLFKILTEMNLCMETLNANCHGRVIECTRKFSVLEKRKLFDRGVAIVSGAVTGALAALGIKIGS